MTDKPLICLNCNGTKLEIKPFEFRLGLGEMYLTMKTDAWECLDCGSFLGGLLVSGKNIHGEFSFPVTFCPFCGEKANE